MIFLFKKKRVLNFNYLLLSFTLVEIIVVITVISILATTSIFSYRTILNASLDSKRKSDIELIRTALETYRSYNSTYPHNLNKLLSDSSGRIYLKTIPLDPKTQNNYDYNPSPNDCNEDVIPCIGYSLSANLSNNKVYLSDPFGSQEIDSIK